MRIPTLHRWPRTPKTAIALQHKLAPQVDLTPVTATPRRFAGADVAFTPDGTQVIAGVVVWDAQEQTCLEQRVARTPCNFPYVPGLLSFRELPGVLAAFRKLRHEPDVVLCDGQGLAHPRRIGLACHLGLWLGRPTVGCAKSRLCGTHAEPAPRKGCRVPLRHNDDLIGYVVRTRDHVKPLYISPGHLCDFDSAVRLTLAATTRYRLPDPTRLAHQLVTKARTT
jgi:deoxyribonuclease V